MKRPRVSKFMIVCAVLTLLSIANAQWTTGFEPPVYTGSPEGTTLRRQDGWYRPTTPTPSVDFSVYTYANNGLGFPSNPNGGTQFIGAVTTSRFERFPRAQHDFDWSVANRWTVSYDFVAGHDDSLGLAANNIGSFSLQPSTDARSFVALNRWMRPGDLSRGWRADYVYYDAAGFEQVATSPGNRWRHLETNHWYRQSTTFDFASNRIIKVSITDLETGETRVKRPVDWYMLGGANPTEPLPTSLRFFVGGDLFTAGNKMGFDNLVIAVPEPGTMSALLVGTGLLAGVRRHRYLKG